MSGKDRTTTHNFHLISDSTGEALITLVRMYGFLSDKVINETVHPLVRDGKKLDDVLRELSKSPGFVLHMLTDSTLSEKLSNFCSNTGLISIDIVNIFRSNIDPFIEGNLDSNIKFDRSKFIEVSRKLDAISNAIDGLRINKLADSVDALRSISQELSLMATDSVFEDCNDSITLKIVRKLGIVLEAAEGIVSVQIVIAGAVASIATGGGFPAALVFALSMAALKGGDAFSKAIDSISGQLHRGNKKLEKKSLGRRGSIRFDAAY